MSIAVGESGKRVILATGIDPSSATSMTIKLVPPSGDDVIIDASRVTAASSIFADPVLGNLAADTYMQFDNVVADFLVSGDYTVCGTYTNTVTDPDDIFITLSATITILEPC